MKVSTARKGKESFHSRLRDEFLAVEEFESLTAARRLSVSWRDDYNQYRPHSSLGDVTPMLTAVENGGAGRSNLVALWG